RAVVMLPVGMKVPECCAKATLQNDRTSTDSNAANLLVIFILVSSPGHHHLPIRRAEGDGCNGNGNNRRTQYVRRGANIKTGGVQMDCKPIRKETDQIHGDTVIVAETGTKLPV